MSSCWECPVPFWNTPQISPTREKWGSGNHNLGSTVSDVKSELWVFLNSWIDIDNFDYNCSRQGKETLVLLIHAICQATKIPVVYQTQHMHDIMSKCSYFFVVQVWIINKGGWSTTISEEKRNSGTVFSLTMKNSSECTG